MRFNKNMSTAKARHYLLPPLFLAIQCSLVVWSLPNNLLHGHDAYLMGPLFILSILLSVPLYNSSNPRQRIVGAIYYAVIGIGYPASLLLIFMHLGNW
jgi:hypothetical protein